MSTWRLLRRWAGLECWYAGFRLREWLRRRANHLFIKRRKAELER